MGQPPGRTSPKRAKGLFYSPSLEAIDEVQDSDAWSAADLQLRLQAFGAKLAQANPGVAVRVFRPQMKQLESELKRAKDRLEKRKKDQAKEQWESKDSKV